MTVTTSITYTVSYRRNEIRSRPHIHISARTQIQCWREKRANKYTKSIHTEHWRRKKDVSIYIYIRRFDWTEWHSGAAHKWKYTQSDLFLVYISLPFFVYVVSKCQQQQRSAWHVLLLLLYCYCVMLCVQKSCKSIAPRTEKFLSVLPKLHFDRTLIWWVNGYVHQLPLLRRCRISLIWDYGYLASLNAVAVNVAAKLINASTTADSDDSTTINMRIKRVINKICGS